VTFKGQSWPASTNTYTGNFTFFSKAMLNPGNVRFGLRDPDFRRIFL
jgi:hypothetical protein